MTHALDSIQIWLVCPAILEDAVGTAAPCIEFVAGAAGKPEIGAPRTEPALRFNLSHTHALTACAVTTIGDVGVDVEEVHAVPLDVAQMLFAPPGIGALLALPASERQGTTGVL